MDFIPKVKLNIDPDLEIDEITGEENPQFVYEEESDDDVDEKLQEEIKQSTYIPEADKDPIIEDEIFESKPKPKPVAKGKKARKPMSEAHKEKLKIAREKALATRRAKAEERKQAKDMEKQEKELIKLKRKKDLEKLRKEVEDEPKPKKEEPRPQIREVIKEVVKEPTITKADLEKAQLDAIIKYEALRKDRKAKKKIDQEQKAHEEAVRQKIMKAMRPNNQFNSGYAGF